MPQPDRIAETLRALGAVFVASLQELPMRERRSTFVNARGQLLAGRGRLLPDPSDAIGTLLFSPDRPPEVDAAVDALLLEPVLTQHVHHCLNDGGAAYIQALDLNVAALKNYFIGPLLDGYLSVDGSRPFVTAIWDALADPILASLRAETTARTLTTPLLGVRLDEGLRLGPRVTIRPATEAERQDWSEDGLFELSIARDILVAEAVVEVSYSSPWEAPRHSPDTGIYVGTFDGVAVADALDVSSLAIAVLRLVTGRSLPLVFTQDQINAIPWARNRFPHRPTLDDTVRRFDTSPLWVRLVDAEPLAVGEIAALTTMWKAVDAAASREPDVLRAVRLLLHERDYVNLYRIFELIQHHAGDRMKSWASRNEADRFTQTANSADAVGDTWARHGRRFSSPRKPMDLRTADALVRHLLSRWIEEEAAASLGPT